jgi:uncharacterized protein
MVLVDTGYLIALFTEADVLHKRAIAWSEALEDRLLFTEYVLIEVANHFHGPQSRDKARAIREWILSDPMCQFVPANSAVSDAGWNLFVSRPDKYWSLTDCISFAVMSERGVTDALAYDIHFEQAGFKALLRYEPA